MNVPKGLQKHEYLGSGSTALVYRINETIVVKYPRSTKDKRFQKELDFYERLKSLTSPPDIVKCYFVHSSAIFLQYCAEGNLHSRLLERQERQRRRVVSVSTYEDDSLISRWLIQLTSAAAFLESVDLAHNDIHPRNLLLDQQLSMKLSDFDSVRKTGDDFPGAPAPYARILNREPDKGTFGSCGARTEQFAIGTILYFMIYGHEPYEDTELDDDEITDRFRDMQFPRLRDRFLELIIRKCWFGEFPSMSSLKSEVHDRLSGTITHMEVTEVKMEEIQAECDALVRFGLQGK